MLSDKALSCFNIAPCLSFSGRLSLLLDSFDKLEVFICRKLLLGLLLFHLGVGGFGISICVLLKNVSLFSRLLAHQHDIILQVRGHDEGKEYLFNIRYARYHLDRLLCCFKLGKLFTFAIADAEATQIRQYTLAFKLFLCGRRDLFFLLSRIARLTKF